VTASEFLVFITYYDMMRSGQEFILRNNEATRAVSLFLPDEERDTALVLNVQTLKNQIFDRLCGAWVAKYSEHVTYETAEGATPSFMYDNTIEGELVKKEISGRTLE